MKKNLFRILAMIMAFTMLFSVAAYAAEDDVVEIEDNYNWTVALNVAETTINYKIMAKFKELIEERSGGKIMVDIYSGGQLGGDNEIHQGVRDGSIQFISSMISGLVDFVPESAVFDLPNLFPDVETMRASLKAYKDTFDGYCQAGGIKLLGFSDAGFRQLTSNKPVASVDDIAGIKLRVMNNQYHIAYWEALGANPLPMDFNEVYMGLQQKTIDGQENPYMNIVGNSMQEVQDYVVETNHLGHVIDVLMNNDLYQSLPDNVRQLVDECMDEAIEYGNSEADASIEADKQTCIDAGCEIVTLSEEDLAAMQEKASIVYDMVRENLGDEVVDGLLEIVEAAK